MDSLKYLCRVCLNKGDTCIFEMLLGISISDRLMMCSSIRVDPNDELPSSICSQCLLELNDAYRFRMKCEESEGKLNDSIELLTYSIQNAKDFNAEDNATDLETPCTDDFIDMESIKNEESTADTTHIKKKHKKTHERKKTKLKRKANDKFHKPKHKVKDVECKIKKNDRVFMVKPKERDKTRKHMCTTCGKTFLFHGNLLDHERVHSGDKPFCCGICDRRFAQSGHLMVHERTHSGVKPYKCEICNRAFTVSHALKKHLRVHTGERPYPCSMCEKSFVTSYHLSNHFKRHTGDKKFKCDWPDCEQGFVNVSEMKRHRARHDKSKEDKRRTSKYHEAPTLELPPLSPGIAQGSIYNDLRKCFGPF